MDEATYLKERVDDQINWLSDKSVFNQKRYKNIRGVIIALSVAIPVLTAYVDEGGLILKISIAIVGALIALFEGFVSLNKYQEIWVQYRATSEGLKQEKMLYLTQSGIYANSETPFQDFVANVESILASENKNWQKQTAQKIKIK